jgi:hypothetical protein
MLSEAEKRRLAELYSDGYEAFFRESEPAKRARREAEFLSAVHRREFPHQSFRELKSGCFHMTKRGLRANRPEYPFLH